MKIALFGGSFDPPHKGHLLVAQTLISQKYVDQVWFVPSATHPFAKKMSPSPDRLKMLQNIPDILISTYELDTVGVTYSIETLEYFAQKYPKHTFSWVIGSDQLAKFAEWHRYHDILKNFGVFVYPRDEYPAEPLLPGMTLLKNVNTSSVSSTKIRSAVARNEDISNLTSQPVISVIKNSQLYKETYE